MSKNKYKEKVVKLVDENKDFETQQVLNHKGNMIDKQTNNKEERGIEMRKETTNKPKKEPFLILTRTKFENKSRRRITNILKKNSQENSKDQKNTQTKNSNKASEAKHKENEHNTKIPATKCILQNCKQQQQRFKKTRERGTKKPHD